MHLEGFGHILEHYFPLSWVNSAPRVFLNGSPWRFLLSPVVSVRWCIARLSLGVTIGKAIATT